MLRIHEGVEDSNRVYFFSSTTQKILLSVGSVFGLALAVMLAFKVDGWTGEIYFSIRLFAMLSISFVVVLLLVYWVQKSAVASLTRERITWGPTMLNTIMRREDIEEIRLIRNRQGFLHALRLRGGSRGILIYGLEDMEDFLEDVKQTLVQPPNICEAVASKCWTIAQENGLPLLGGLLYFGGLQWTRLTVGPSINLLSEFVTCVLLLIVVLFLRRKFGGPLLIVVSGLFAALIVLLAWLIVTNQGSMWWQAMVPYLV